MRLLQPNSIGPISLALLFAPLARGQDELPAGPVAGQSVSISLAQPTTGPAADQILIHANGISPATPQPYASAVSPDFRISTIFGTALASLVDVDAISTGNDIFPINSSGEIDPSILTADWVSIHFSVANSTSTSIAEEGSPLRTRIQNSMYVGADIYTYHALANPDLEESLDDEVVLTRPSEQMNLNGTTGDLDALDFQLPIVVALGDQGNDPAIPFKNRLYFSITQTSADAIKAIYTSLPLPGVFAALTSLSDLSGAHIYLTTWIPNGGGGGSWSQASIVKGPQALGLPMTSETDRSNSDIDALALYGATEASNQFRFLFSTRGFIGSQSQVRIAYIPPSGGGLIVADAAIASRGPVRERIKLGSSANVTGLGAYDPELAGSLFSKAYATPVNVNTWYRPLHLSAALVTSSSPTILPNQISFTLSGWAEVEPTSGLVDLGIWYWGPGIAPSYISLVTSASRGATDHQMHWTFPIDLAAMNGLSIVGAATCTTASPEGEGLDVRISYLPGLSF